MFAETNERIMAKNKSPNLADKKASAESRRTSEEVNELRGRMVSAKTRLPMGAVTKFISLFPAYNAYKKSSRVRLVFNLTVVDEEITTKFEELADLIEAEAAKQKSNQNK